MAAAAEPVPSSWRRQLPAVVLIGSSAAILPFVARPALLAAALGGLVFALLIWYAFARPKQWPLLFCAAAILLPPVPFPIGDTGAHPSILIAGAGLLGGIASLHRWRVELRGLNAALAAVLAAMLLSLGFALYYSGPAIAGASAARLALLSIGVFVYLTASQGPGRQNLVEAERTARFLFWVAAAAALFGCIDFVYQLPAPAGYGAQFIWLASGIYRRAQGLFYDASALGNFCAFFLVMSVTALVRRRLVPVYVAAGGVMLFLAALLLSFSRAALAASMIACLVLAILERRRWWRPKVIIALAVLVGITASGFTLALPEIATGYWARIALTWDRMFTTPDQVLSGRLDTWFTIGNIILEHPWQVLLGIGYKTLPYTQHFGHPVIADNMYLSALVETGVLGLLALIVLNAAILITAYRAYKRGSFFGQWMLCFWVGETFQMMAGDILTFWRVLPVYFWLLAQVARESS